jgi:hypothetical protein
MVFRRLRGWRSDIGLETSRTVVVLEVLLRNTIEGERGNGVVTTWSGDAPGAMGAGPTGEVVPFEPDQAFTHASPAFCVRFGFKLGDDGRNTSRERARNVISCPSLETILHGIANEGSD